LPVTWRLRQQAEDAWASEVLPEPLSPITPTTSPGLTVEIDAG
jgi:hypothetical protein